ncbi:MAG: deoxyribodipyrimidine photo-lyase [Coriobacteriia bacterium]|nr:deoxyribodipyrimidine photo-lyase [Coriobacteriia bacterium]MBN2822338.1 deoxyribodipyrimidine photo-lyase [Coriobacteriia bacterium]
MTRRAIVMFRNDLRLADNQSLSAALASAERIIPVYIHAPIAHGDWPQGSASRSWLARSLASLDADLRARGSRLIIRTGDPNQILPSLAAETLAGELHLARRHGPALRRAEASVVAHLAGAGLEVHSHEAALLRRPDDLRNNQGEPYRMFTPFYRAAQQLGEPASPLPAPSHLPAPEVWPNGLPPEAVLEPGDRAHLGSDDGWQPGETGAHARMRLFFDELVGSYIEGRDRPDIDGSSRLSAHLSFGEIGARQLWHAASDALAAGGGDIGQAQVTAFVRQLYWREFAYHLLVNFPLTPEQPLHERFASFPWADDPEGMSAWQEGRTGYPIVDAGMRQLAETGWMHNRVRMVAASFLTKDLLLPWQDGARWFWEHLTDADLANNTLGWQWVAGCGADAAPYFRVFNPVLQGQKFDPDGAYVKRWVPELAKMPTRWIHRPWEAPDEVLSDAGVALGQSYPRPIIDHAEARKRALAVYETTRKSVGRQEPF